MKLTTQVVLAVLCFSVVGNVQATFFERIPNLACPCATGNKCDLGYHWITQKLDHFDKSETRSWQMRYLANNEYFENGAPMFVLIGGEWEISESYLHCGHFHDIAKEHKGYLFYTEHRYYGESNPTAGVAMANVKDEFKYLNAKQALADLEHFILTIKKTTPGLTNSKVVIAGGSYAGSLAVWLKKLHPNLVAGSWASSAPLLAKLDFSETYAFIVETYRVLGGDKCYNRIKNGFAQLKTMLNNDEDLFFVSGDFDIYNPLDKQSLLVQILSDFKTYLNNNAVQKACELVMKGEENVKNLLLREVASDPYYVLTYDVTLRMYLYNDDFKDSYRFLYQKCNEFGWFWTFGKLIPTSFYTQQCAELFGDEFTDSYIEKKIAETNKIFGGLSSSVQNIFMTHGQYDPWKFLGLKDGATIISGAFHCSDLFSISSDDSKEMMAAKEQIAQEVRNWVG